MYSNLRIFGCFDIYFKILKSEELVNMEMICI